MMMIMIMIMTMMFMVMMMMMVITARSDAASGLQSDVDRHTQHYQNTKAELAEQRLTQVGVLMMVMMTMMMMMLMVMVMCQSVVSLQVQLHEESNRLARQNLARITSMNQFCDRFQERKSRSRVRRRRRMRGKRKRRGKRSMPFSQRQSHSAQGVRSSAFSGSRWG